MKFIFELFKEIEFCKEVKENDAIILLKCKLIYYLEDILLMEKVY